MNNEFESYVMEFYAPNACGYIFGNTLTLREVKLAIALRLSNKTIPFEGDSYDRELVRDIILVARGEAKTEHNVAMFFQEAKPE